MTFGTNAKQKYFQSFVFTFRANIDTSSALNPVPAVLLL